MTRPLHRELLKPLLQSSPIQLITVHSQNVASLLSVSTIPCRPFPCLTYSRICFKTFLGALWTLDAFVHFCVLIWRPRKASLWSYNRTNSIVGPRLVYLIVINLRERTQSFSPMSSLGNCTTLTSAYRLELLAVFRFDCEDDTAHIPTLDAFRVNLRQHSLLHNNAAQEKLP